MVSGCTGGGRAGWITSGHRKPAWRSIWSTRAAAAARSPSFSLLNRPQTLTNLSRSSWSALMARGAALRNWGCVAAQRTGCDAAFAELNFGALAGGR